MAANERTTRTHTTIWLVLVVLTLMTFMVGELHLGGLGALGLVLTTMLIKGQLVADWFMGLRQAPRLWRLVVTGYLFIIGSAIALAYVLGLE